MTDASGRKEGFKKCRSATFSIDGYSFTIGENFPRPGPPHRAAGPLEAGAGGAQGAAGPRAGRGGSPAPQGPGLQGYTFPSRSVPAASSAARTREER
ncbi:Dual specificity calcium/calmodulin-dependent 3',5'-cyclic nucleotide phosphodiesterase 1C [Vulpes lagopus]